MTGEITLRGDVLPIGGLKEKVLAAKLAGIHTVIVPKLNQRDLAEIPATITDGLTFHFVDHMDEVLKLALLETEPGSPTRRPTATRRDRQRAAAARHDAEPAPVRSGEDRLLAWLRRQPGVAPDRRRRRHPPRAGEHSRSRSTARSPASTSLPISIAAASRGALLAVNLSDLAAMGATPAYAFLALSAAPGFDHRAILPLLHRRPAAATG